MMLSFTSGTLVAGPEAAAAAAAGTAVAVAKANSLDAVRTVFVASVIFNSYLIGIVAGKISDESVSSGFKHATILVIISLIAAKLMPMFIKL